MTNAQESPLTFAKASRRIAGLALPLCLALFIDAATQFVIAALLGHMGSDALYLRTIYLPFAFLILAVQEGFGIATQVLFARLRGRGRPDWCSEALARVVLVGLLALVGLAVAIGLLAPVLAGLLHVPSEKLGIFTSFTWLMAGAAITTVPAIVTIAALRGWGRPGWSLVLSLAFASVQALGVWLVGMFLGGGVLVLPLFVVAAGLVGGLMAPMLLRRGGLVPQPGEFAVALGGLVRRRIGNGLEPGRLVRSLLLRVGIPVGLSYALLMFANLATLLVLTPFGTNVQTAFGGAATTQTLVVMPAIGLASATAVVMNQQIGAARQKELPATFRAAAMMATGGYLTVGLLLFLLTPVLVQTLAGDDVVRGELEVYLTIVAPSLASLGIVLFLVTLLEQLGAGILAVVLNLLYYASSLGLGGLLSHASGQPETLYVVLALSNVLGMLVVFPVTFIVIRRRAHQASPGAATQSQPASPMSGEPEAGATT